MCWPASERRGRPARPGGRRWAPGRLAVLLTFLLLLLTWAPAGAVGLGSLRYNRVEGLFISLKESFPARAERGLVLGMELGVGAASRQARYRLDLGHAGGWGRGGSWRGGVRLYDLTDTTHRWRSGEWENSLAAVFFRSDFRDYFGRRGVALYLQGERDEGRLIGIEWRSDEYRSLSVEADWSVKGGIFRANPSVGRSSRRSVHAVTEWEWGGGRRRTRLSGEGEVAAGESLRPARARLEVRRYWPLGGNTRVLCRGRAGGGRGPLPPEWRHSLGGIDALRGLPFQALSGERFLLLGVELLEGGDLLAAMRLPVISHLQLWGTVEAGSVWRRALGESRERWVASTGLGVGDLASFVRLEVARRLTTRRSPLRIYLRINRPL